MRYSAVHAILQLRTYLGEFEDGEPGRWPALVDPEPWQRAQEAIARHKHLPKQASRDYLLTGFLRCERCGSRMSGWHQRGRSLLYRCSGNQQGASSPDFRCYDHMRCEPIDQQLLAEAAAMLDVLTARDPRVRALLHERWQESRGRSITDGVAVTTRHFEQEADKASKSRASRASARCGRRYRH